MVWPYLNVKQGKYRFRLLNGSNSRFLTLSLSDGGALTVIGTDGGLLPQPVVRDSPTISRGMDRVRRFTWDRAAKQILDVYRSLI